APGEMLERGRWQRGKEREAEEQIELALGHDRPLVNPAPPGPGDERKRRQQEAGGDERPADTEQRDEERSDDRAQAECGDDEALEHAEDAPEHLLRCGPLQKREARDVDERVADTEQTEEDDRRSGVRPGTEQDEG